MIVPALFFIFDVRVVEASVPDAVMHFAPMLIAQIAVTIWLGGGRMLPLISDVYQLLVAPEIIKVVVLTLIRPHVSKVPILFSNSGSGCQALQRLSFAGPTVLSAVGVSPPHDGVR